ncbi:LOW QUALITY PROTEIN: uncharacterized protein [Amphiura filiformis]|uniref:LOW QUALITY PROTEIN: uncharacterized protein n=1 Tax=Amphiura filiformis TaxID=82378 RepID=UPI003B216F1D
MATGGVPIVRNSQSEPRVRGPGNGASARGRQPPTSVEDIFRFNWIGEKDDDKPNNYWNWKPSATFADSSSLPEPRSKKTKTKNKDRDKRVPNQSHTPTAGHNSSDEGRQHTPATYPRTKFVGSVRERAELETLKQQLLFSDMDEQQSVDSQARGASGATGVAVNNTRKDTKRPAVALMNGPLSHQQDEARAGAVSAAPNGPSRNAAAGIDANLLNELPDRNQIVARLMQIRDYIKQASTMMSNLEKSRTDGGAGDEQVEKLLRLREHLQDQEKGYLALLERMLAEESSGEGDLQFPLDSGRNSHNSQNSGESFASSAARSTSINLDARSDISEATTEGTFTARTRPRIESTLGFTQSDNEYESGAENADDDIRSVSSLASTGMISGLDTQELHEQFSVMLRKYQEGVEDFEASSTTETEEQEGPHILLKGPRGMPEGSTTTDDTTEDDVSVNRRMEELTGLRQQHDLLKTMLQQQEELKALQNRQEALMKLQGDIETRLLRSEQSKGETTEDTESQSTMHSLPSQDLESTLKASSSTAVVPQDEEETGRHRRDVLMSLLAEDRDKRTMELEQARTLDRIAQQEAELTAMSAQRQSLQDKVEALQRKKHQMDSLLHQFQELRPILGPSEGDGESSIASSVVENEAPRIVGSPGGDASQQAEEVEARDKLRRLQEVHQRLNELKELVQQYQGVEGSIEGASQTPSGSGAASAAADAASALANFEDPDLMSNLRFQVLDELLQEYHGSTASQNPGYDLRQLEQRVQAARLQTHGPNIKDDESSQATQTEDTVSQQQTDNDEDDEDTTNATNTEDETESTQSSILALWGDDPEIREKVRKLQAAKQKLRQLQDLVAMVQQTPEVMNMLPDDLAELALTFDDFSEQLDDEDNDEEEEGRKGKEEEDEEDEQEEEASEISEGEAPQTVSRQTREAYFEAKMQQQRSELEKLVEERHRLLSVQEQLRDLNQRLPNSATLPRPQTNASTAKLQNVERKPQNPQNRQPQLYRSAVPSTSTAAAAVNQVRSIPTPMRREDVMRDMMRSVVPPTAAVNQARGMPTPMRREDVMRDMMRSAVPHTSAAAAVNQARGMPTPTREDVMREMMKHRRLQLELQQKKEELSSLLDRVKGHNRQMDENSQMTYSVTSGDMDDNDNDLFRVSMRSADVTAAGTWGGSTQASDDEDAYAINGIVQVEEEEEEDDTSIAGTADTYTIEADYRQQGMQRRKYPTRDTDAAFDASHGVHYPKWSPRMAYGYSARRQENVRSAEELMAEVGPIPGDYSQSQPPVDANMWQIQQLQNQLSNSMGMCQGLIQDQQTMSGLLQSSMSGGYGGVSSMTTPNSSLPTHTPPGSDPRLQQMVNDYNLRLQHQQLQLNLNTAYNQLYNQQQEIHRMYERLQGNASSVTGSIAGSERSGHNNLNNNRSTAYDASNPYDYTPPFASLPSNLGPQYGAQSSGYPFSMNPTFPANFSSLPNQSKLSNQYNGPHNDTDSQRDYDAFARYRVGRENYEGENYHIPPNTAAGSVDHDGGRRIIKKKQERENLGMPTATYPGLADLYRLDFTNSPASRIAAAEGGTPNERDIPPLDIRSLLKKSEKQRRRREVVEQQAVSKPLRDPRAVEETTGKKPGRPGTAAGARARLAAMQSPKYAWGPQPGLSGGISGTAFLDTASLTSTMSFSSMPGDLEGGGGTPKAPDSQRSLLTTSEMESDAGSEFSLFEALRESIYSEVATLISQNEARPHFLIELFRELQMLTTDYLRQRALYALQDLVSKYLTEDSVRTAPRPAEATGYLNAAAVTMHQQPPWQISASEHTPSESYITSEDDEMKAQLYSQGFKKSKGKGKKSKVKGAAAAGGDSLASDQYDYMENIDSASEISTPPSTGPGDFGFANDELGDTVIHLDKALQRMREYERMKAEAEAAAASGGATAGDSKEDDIAETTDATSNSSAQDMGSESSFSDLPYPRIDTRQLDLQIKSIMQEVIPYLKEHMDDVCSPQLLSYIRRLVLTLARQRDDSREFVRFFNRQLGSILQDSLAKFSGRKMRECGEDLLVDISEILFNELAFFRLMQDLDTTGSKLQKEAEEEDDDEEEEEEEGDGATETATETETGQEDATGDDTSSEEEEDEEGETEDDTGASLSPPSKPLMVTALAAAADVTPDEQEAIEAFMNDASQKEEEELGKNRDDDLAGKMDISDKDEDSEATVDKDQVKIALSMSESIAVTYLGSGEEDDDLDSLSECVDETITSIGAAGAEIETDPESQHQVAENEAAASTPQPQVNGEIEEREEETPVPQETNEEAEIKDEEDDSGTAAKETKEEEEKEKADGSPSSSDGSPSSSDGLSQGGNGGGVDANDNKVTIDDLPTKGVMTSLSQIDIEMKMSEEQTNNTAAQAALDNLPGGEAELAGDPQGLKEPDTTTPPVQDGIVSAAGDVGSE